MLITNTVMSYLSSLLLCNGKVCLHLRHSKLLQYLEQVGGGAYEDHWRFVGTRVEKGARVRRVPTLCTQMAAATTVAVWIQAVVARGQAQCTPAVTTPQHRFPGRHPLCPVHSFSSPRCAIGCRARKGHHSAQTICTPDILLGEAIPDQPLWTDSMGLLLAWCSMGDQWHRAAPNCLSLLLHSLLCCCLAFTLIVEGLGTGGLDSQGVGGRMGESKIFGSHQDARSQAPTNREKRLPTSAVKYIA